MSAFPINDGDSETPVEQDFDKVLYAVAVVGTGTPPKKGIVHFIRTLTGWSEERTMMAFARCEEFGFISRSKEEAPTPIKDQEDQPCPLRLTDRIPLRDPGIPTALRDERPSETGCGLLFIIGAVICFLISWRLNS